MAIRHYWFVFSAAISAFLATQTPLILSAVIGIMSNDRTAVTYARLLQSQPILFTGAAVALGALLLFLLYYAGLSLVDGIQMSIASRRLHEYHEEGAEQSPDDFATLLVDFPSLEVAAANYAKDLLGIPDATAGHGGLAWRVPGRPASSSGRKRPCIHACSDGSSIRFRWC